MLINQKRIISPITYSKMGGGSELANEGHSDSITTHNGSSIVNLPFSSNYCSSMKFDSYRSCNGSVFGRPPSQLEVRNAIDDLHRLMDGISALDSECKGLKQMLYQPDPRMIQSLGYRRIQDAYHMLQNDPPFQRMVISISSDKVVWDAIVSNRAVQDLQGTLQTAREEKRQISCENSDLASLLSKWIVDIMTKTKVVDLIEKLGLLVDQIVKSSDHHQEEKPTSELNILLEEKVRSSLLLSVVILLIVVFARSHES